MYKSAIKTHRRTLPFPRENIENKRILVEHKSSDEMTADIFTKALLRQKLEYHIRELGLK